MPFIEDCFIGQFILLDLEFIKWKKMCMYIAWCVNPLKLPDKFSKHCIWVCAFSEKVLSFQPVVSFLTPKFYRLSIIYLSVLYLHQGKSTVTSDINYIILNILEYFGFYLSLSQRITFFLKKTNIRKQNHYNIILLKAHFCEEILVRILLIPSVFPWYFLYEKCLAYMSLFSKYLYPRDQALCFTPNICW